MARNSAVIKTLLKGCGLLLLIFAYLIIGSVWNWLSARKNRLRVRGALLLTQGTSRLALRVLGVQCQVDGFHHLSQKNPCLVVANHISTLDILLLAACAPLRFVTSVEMRESGFEGILCQLSGSLFVERRTVMSLKQEIAEIEKALEEGHSVVVFPEATSTDGTEVRPFHTALFESVRKIEAPIQPACLYYGDHAKQVAYFGTMSFAAHLKQLVSTPAIEASVIFLPSVQSQDRSRKEMGQRVHAAITSTYDQLKKSDHHSSQELLAVSA